MDGDNDDYVVANNAAIGALELEPNNSKPSDRISAPGDAKTIKSSQLALIVLFACFGSGTVFIARNYTAGFYIDFLTENGLNKTFGTIAISTMFITQAISPYISSILPGLRKIQLTKRCLMLITGNILCYFVMAAVDVMVEKNPGGALVFTVIGITRALQGVFAGLFFAIVQGEIVDLYLADKKTLMVIISGSMHVALFISTNVGAQLYIAGGWMLTGFLIAVFDVLLILLLPFVARIQRHMENEEVLASNKVSTTSRDPSTNGKSLKDKPSRSQGLAFFVPDVAVFLNNVTYILLLYAIPQRIKKFTGKSLSTAVLLSSLMTVVGFLSSITLGFVADRKMKSNSVMLIGNIAFYVGAILDFGSTTEFLVFPASFEIGSILVGIGDAAVINIAIMSKFGMYEKWGIKTDGLAERSTSVFNFCFCISQAVGTVLSGLTVSRASEIPLITTALAACLVNTMGFIWSSMVK